MRLIYIISIALTILLVMGVEQCPTQSGIGGANAQAKAGLDVSFVPGVGYFTSGMSIDQGNTFRIVLKLSNYDKTEKRGTICLKDNQDDAYGGISSSGDCTSFYVDAADFQGEIILSPSSQTIIFPMEEEYSYQDIPVAQSAKLYVITSYVQNSVIQGNVNVPEPAQETVDLSQLSSPITLSVEKTVSKQQNEYKTNLGITITKSSDSAIEIYTPDMQTKSSIKLSLKLSSKPNFPGYVLDCSDISSQGIVNIDNTKYIKCSALLPLEQVSHPLLIYTDYGVKMTNSFDFKIKEKEA